MAAAIGSVRAIFSASSSGLVRATEGAGGALRRLNADVSRTRSLMGTLVAINAAQLFAGVASTATNAARSLIAFGDREAEVIDQTSKLAARIGFTYGELQSLKIVEDDISFDAIAAAATKLDVALVRAAEGSAVAQRALAGVGLAVADLQGMSAAERFSAVADAIAGIPSEAERAAAAVRLFGRAGAGLLPLFNAGAGAIAQARTQAERLGLALTQEQTASVQGMKDAFEGAGRAVQGVVQQVVAYLAPAVETVFNTFTQLVGQIGGANIGQTIGEGILVGARAIAEVADYFLGGSTDVYAFFRSVGEYWGGVFDSGARVGAAFSAAGNVMALAFRSLAYVITGPVEALLSAAKTVADALGYSSPLLDSAVAAAGAFNDELAKGASANFQSAVDSIDFATSARSLDDLGQATAGPLTAALDAAAARARAATQSADAVGRLDLNGRGGAADTSQVGRAVSAVDSRSTEGVKEMFRLMRGGADDVQEQQLGVLEEIAENTAGGGMDVTELEFGR